MIAKKGFTLVELLIVIGIIGLLAVGAVVMINPVEQLNRARDNSTRTAAKDFFDASYRYFAIHESFPWSSAITSVNLATGASVYLNSLIDTGELKSDFRNKSELSQIYITSTSPSVAADLAVCFTPKSKALEAEAVYNISGVSGCPATATCYWCAK